MFTAKRLTTTSLAILALGSSAVLVGPSGSTTAEAQPAAPISASPYPVQGPNPLDPPGCWSADGIWYPDCWGPGQSGPGMTGPRPWGPGMGPGMMGPGPWAPASGDRA
jgi:hypothetical protein